MSSGRQRIVIEYEREDVPRRMRIWREQWWIQTRPLRRKLRRVAVVAAAFTLAAAICVAAGDAVDEAVLTIAWTGMVMTLVTLTAWSIVYLGRYRRFVRVLRNKGPDHFESGNAVAIEFDGRCFLSDRRTIRADVTWQAFTGYLLYDRVLHLFSMSGLVFQLSRGAVDPVAFDHLVETVSRHVQPRSFRPPLLMRLLVGKSE